MRTKKSNINYAVRVIYPDHQPVFVTGDIEYDSTILQNTGLTKIALHHIWRIPISFKYLAIPRQCWLFRVNEGWVAFPKCLNGRYGNYSHECMLVPNWDIGKRHLDYFDLPVSIFIANYQTNFGISNNPWISTFNV